MDGFSAARAIRAFEKSSGCERVTIVAVTGLGDVAAQEKAFASGMDLFLTKPVKMKELRDVLEGVRGGGGVCESLSWGLVCVWCITGVEVKTSRIWEGCVGPPRFFAHPLSSSEWLVGRVFVFIIC